MSNRARVKEALNLLASGKTVESVADALLYQAPQQEVPEQEVEEATEDDIVVSCFECEFSSNNEEDLLTHYTEDHNSSYDSVEEVFESYGLDFNQELAALNEGDDEDEDDSEEDDSEDDSEESDDEEQEESAPLA